MLSTTLGMAMLPMVRSSRVMKRPRLITTSTATGLVARDLSVAKRNAPFRFQIGCEVGRSSLPGYPESASLGSQVERPARGRRGSRLSPTSPGVVPVPPLHRATPSFFLLRDEGLQGGRVRPEPSCLEVGDQ